MKTWIYKFTLHKELKQVLLKSIEYSDGKQVQHDPYSADDSISRTDYYSEKSLDEKGYLTLLHNNLNDFYVKLHAHYCLRDSQLLNGWYQQYTVGDKHGWHCHGQTSVAFVYYLELPDPKECTELIEYDTMVKYQPDVVEGDIFVFPGMIPHRSPIINGDQRKTVISCNISFGYVDSPQLESRLKNYEQ